MTSRIDPTKPIDRRPLTASVRLNFLQAQREIDDLQIIMRIFTTLTGLNFYGPWIDGEYYDPGATVTYNGTMYESLDEADLHTPPPYAPEIWVNFDPGVRLVNSLLPYLTVPVGAWDSGLAYSIGQMVTHNGSAWRCVALTDGGSGDAPGISATWTLYLDGNAIYATP